MVSFTLAYLAYILFYCYLSRALLSNFKFASTYTVCLYRKRLFVIALSFLSSQRCLSLSALLSLL